MDGPRSLPRAPRSARHGQPAQGACNAYRRGLRWAFTLSQSLRLLAYLPVIAAIHASGETSQHSLLTWLTWLGANLTMACWTFEQNGHRLDRAVLLSAGSASMCAVVVAQIVLGPARG